MVTRYNTSYQWWCWGQSIKVNTLFCSKINTFPINDLSHPQPGISNDECMDSVTDCSGCKYQRHKIPLLHRFQDKVMQCAFQYPLGVIRFTEGNKYWTIHPVIWHSGSTASNNKPLLARIALWKARFPGSWTGIPIGGHLHPYIVQVGFETTLSNDFQLNGL